LIDQLQKDDTIVLVGFDNTYLGKALPIKEGFPDAYAVLETTSFKHYTGDMSPKFRNHDYPGERALIAQRAQEKGIVVRYAQDIWG
jgi:hypothetical protein